MKRISYLEAKTDDLENRAAGRTFACLASGKAPRVSSLLEYIREVLPRWLETDKSFVIERAHRTLAPPKPNQHRAVLIRFLNFQDREFVFRSTKQRNIEHEGNKLFFAQDLSAETVRQRAEFSTVRKVFIEKGIFRGFQYNPCKMRILHNGKLQLFSTPKETGDFLCRHAGQD